MLVKILAFGSNWWTRFGRDPHDAYRFSRHAAYFNSTGLRSGRRLRRYWTIPGMLRFNVHCGFNPHFPNRSIGETFECADVAVAFGGNRLLFMRKASNRLLPDYYLVTVFSGSCGRFDCRTSGWKSEGALPIAVSQHQDRSEALLLMRFGDSITTSLGIWQLTVHGTECHPVVSLV